MASSQTSAARLRESLRRIGHIGLVHHRRVASPPRWECSRLSVRFVMRMRSCLGWPNRMAPYTCSSRTNMYLLCLRLLGNKPRRGPRMADPGDDSHPFALNLSTTRWYHAMVNRSSFWFNRISRNALSTSRYRMHQTSSFPFKGAMTLDVTRDEEVREEDKAASRGAFQGFLVPLRPIPPKASERRPRYQKQQHQRQ